MKVRVTLIGALAVISCKTASKESVDKAPAEPTPITASTSKVDAQPAPTPDEVSEASEPHQTGPSVITTESVDGAALRKRIVKRLRSDRSPVTLLRGQSALELGEAICEAVVPKVPTSLPVLLKPNLGGFAAMKKTKQQGGDNGVVGRTTDPEFVRGVIRCLRARGHQQITVADSWNADPDRWQVLMQVSGYRDMSEAEGVDLVALSDDGVFDVEGSQPGKPLAISGMESTSVPTLLMPKLLAEHLDHGLVISLPKIKSHRFSVVSLSIKGLQGTVMYSDKSPAYRQKWRSHRDLGPYLKAFKKQGIDDREVYVAALETFSERMVDVLEVEAPHVVLAEGAPAMSGDGFNKLIPSAEMVAIGGTNPVLVDAVGARFLGLFDNSDLARELGGHTTSPLIEVAAKRFGLDLSDIAIVGNGAALLDAARPVHFIGMAPFEIHSAESQQAVPLGQGDEPSELEAPDNQPIARAKHVGSSSIELDGKADEAIWQAAERVSWDTNYAGEKTAFTSHARFAWGKDTLYAYFEIEGAGLFVDTSRKTDVERDELYKEDCVELFIAPDASRPGHYFEIEVGPYGHWLDIEVDLDRKKGRFDQTWSSGVRIATTRDATTHRASMEIAIHSRDIAVALVEGARLPIGLFRMEGRSPNKQYLAWSPARTDKPKFHLPEAFGLLVLEP